MTETRLNRRLTMQDASFLYVDRPSQPMHGAWVGLYEGHMALDEVIRAIEGRLHRMPRYRQKVVFPPFIISHPTWEDDADFDIRRHIVEDTLPPPGDDGTMATVVGKLLSPQMDFTRPLWKMVVLQGRADGNTAVIHLTHHAMVDGISGVDLLLVMHDLRPDAEPPAPPTTVWQPAPQPDPLTLMQDAVRDQLVEAAQRWTDDTFLQYRPAEAAARAQQITGALFASMPAMLQPPPRTPFNGPISRERDVSWARFSFTEIRAIRAVLGGTINDVVLTVVAGALGRYMRRHGYPTDGVELRAMCPVSMRAPSGRGALGNQVSMMMAPLYVGILHPVERLKAERTAMERLKEQDQAGGFYAMTQAGTPAPPAVQAFMGQLETPNTLLHTVSTNVPGPQIPLYMSGHKLLANWGMGMLSANIGLFNAIGSYNQMLTIGATVDPKQVPDPWFYAECLKESFSELSQAAERAAVATGAPSPGATAATTPVPNGKHSASQTPTAPRGHPRPAAA
jgi:diacylglycerol O-acyltransferase / wax synthase